MHESIFLGDVVSHKKGFAFKSSNFESSGIPVVKVTNFTGSSVSTSDLVYVSESHAEEKRKFRLNSGDIVIQTVGSWPNNPLSVVGRVVMIPKELDGSLLNQNAVIIYPKETLNKQFLFYLLKDRSFQGYIINTAQGAANQASVTLDSIFRFQFFNKNLETQRKIAAILTAYDDLIETNKRRIALLEKMAEEIYREWFVRLRFPGYQNTQFIKGIPEGWEVKRLRDILELAYGKALKETDRDSGQFNVYGSGGIVGSHSKALVNKPGIIVGRKGNVGAIHFSDRGFFPIDTVFYVVSELPLTYLFFLLNTLNFINNDAAVPGLNRNQAYSNQFFFPGDRLIKKFSSLVDPIFELKHQLQAQNENLTKTRDLLLPRLISGKLHVEHLDIQTPPSMNP